MLQVANLTGKSERHGLNAPFFIKSKRATFTFDGQCGGPETSSDVRPGPTVAVRDRQSAASSCPSRRST